MTGLYLDHVADLEEWNEDWDHEWLKPAVIRAGAEVIVYHPVREHGYPDLAAQTVVIATYHAAGAPISLRVVNGGNRDDVDYWSSDLACPIEVVWKDEDEVNGEPFGPVAVRVGGWLRKRQALALARKLGAEFVES